MCVCVGGSALQDSAFGYFITACVVILLAILSYFVLPQMDFFQYHLECNGSRPSGDEENKMDLLRKGNTGVDGSLLSLLACFVCRTVRLVSVRHVYMGDRKSVV